MCLEHHLVGGYVLYISPYIIIIIKYRPGISFLYGQGHFTRVKDTTIYYNVYGNISISCTNAKTRATEATKVGLSEITRL